MPELNCFFPEEPVKRKQVAAMLYEFGQYLKGANPTLNIIVPEAPADPLTQHFEDVPPGNPFAPAINALAMAGIVAGRPCEEP